FQQSSSLQRIFPFRWRYPFLAFCLHLRTMHSARSRLSAEVMSISPAVFGVLGRIRFHRDEFAPPARRRKCGRSRHWPKKAEELHKAERSERTEVRDKWQRKISSLRTSIM